MNGQQKKMDLGNLRHLNQELLQKLRTNQEEIKRRIQAKPASPSSRPERNDQRAPDAEKGLAFQKENQSWFSKDGPDTVMPDFAEARPGPQSPSKPTSSLREKPTERTQKGDAAHAKEGGQARASARMPQGPKSILLTPPCSGGKEKTKKEGGRVKFVSDPEEPTIPAGDWSIRPFLGYDWIAGLLDVDSSLSEKPEQYFHELQNFRRVNRDDCICDQDSRLDGLDSLARDRELDQDPSSHQCVFCYRLNKRLFTEPLDPESACPVCKTPRARRPPETLVEPAFVRISIPRSTLLPAYKHKIHCRKSYEAADNLALPSHCLAGWENPVRAPSPTHGSLDLRSSLDGGGGGRIHWMNWEPWVCMCDVGKQARIRHFVVHAANLSVKPEASEFWQEKPCSAHSCTRCRSEECPDGDGQEDAGFARRFEALAPHRPHDVEIPLPPRSDFPTYDSLPVVDDAGDEWEA